MFITIDFYNTWNKNIASKIAKSYRWKNMYHCLKN